MKIHIWRPRGKAIFYCKFRLPDGRQIMRSTRVSDRELAEAAAQRIVAQETGGDSAGSAENSFAMTNQPSTGPTLGMVIGLYLRRLERPSERTKVKNVNDLLAIVRTRFPEEDGRPLDCVRPRLLAESLGVIGEETVRAFIRKRGGRRDKAAASNATVNSMLNHARSVFKASALAVYARELWGDALPGCVEQLRAFVPLPILQRQKAKRPLRRNEVAEILLELRSGLEC